ncbi:MAG: hypothetical protein ABI877_15290 [Gemmatimonadaceae bacterium]
MLNSLQHARLRWRRTLIASAGLLLVTRPILNSLGAQQSPVTVGLAGAGGALPGFTGLVSNPALLALPGMPRVSISLPAIDAGLGLAPVGFTAFTPFSGELIPASVRTTWLDQIRAAGGGSMDASLGVRALGVQIGAFALVGGTTAGAQALLPPEAAQLLLFGNAGRTGALEDIAVSGGTARAWVVSSIGLSHGRRLPIRPFGGALAVGATANMLIGHALADLAHTDADIGGTTGTIAAHGSVLTWGDTLAANSKGMSLDVAAAWTRGRLTFGATMSNVMNTLRFSEKNAFARERDITATSDSSLTTSNDGALYLNGTANDMFGDDVRAQAADVSRNARFRPALHFASRYALRPSWDLLADVSLQPDPSTALTSGPRRAFATATEFRGLPVVTLRAGLAAQQGSEGTRLAFSGGFGLRVFALRIDAGATQQKGPGAETLRVAFGTGLTFGGVGR